MPNSGRLQELLVPGARIWASAGLGPKRRTQWNLALVEIGSTLVSVDSRHANQLAGALLSSGSTRFAVPHGGWRAEIPWGASRFDFGRDAADGRWLLEIKCVTLVQDSVARFPDAPTVRVTRHVRELTALALDGARTGVFFLIQRGDAQWLEPNDRGDPVFGAALRSAAAAGVMVRAYTCEVRVEGLKLDREVPVILS